MILGFDQIRKLAADGHDVRIAPDGSVEITSGCKKTASLSDAERAKRYRDRRRVTENVTNDAQTVAETVTDSVTHEPETVTTVTENVTNVTGNVTLPLSPPTPSPYRAEAPASAPMREEAAADDLFPDNKPEPEISPAKRIRWTPEAGWQGITDEDRARWADAYPACDISRQLSSATNWLLANPREAKKSNFARFLNGWLSRAQERGGDARAERYTQTTASNANRYPSRNPGPPAPGSFKSFQPPSEADKQREWKKEDFIIS